MNAFGGIIFCDLNTTEDHQHEISFSLHDNPDEESVVMHSIKEYP
jgi:hypothetical protein